jgi:two-component system cell cycle response regulator DivK
MPRVLLVEDIAMNREMLSRRLVRRGFEVTVAAEWAGGRGNGPPRYCPTSSLMDMSLPVLDGWAATRLLKAEASSRDAIPVIALTAHAMAGDRAKALACGCDDYDTKPIELPRLLDKMDRLLV